MFKHTLLDSVNIFCKGTALFVFIISLLLIHNPVFFMMVSFFFFVFLHRHRYIGMMSLFATLLAMISIFFSQFLWISKMLIFIIYVCLLARIIHTPMIKYIFEKTFYRFQSRSFTTFIVTIIYFPGLLKKNWRKIDSLRKNYGLKQTKNYYVNLFKRVFRISVLELKEIILLHKLRLYNCKKARTFIDEVLWEKWDTSYLCVHILFFFITVVWGR